MTPPRRLFTVLTFVLVCVSLPAPAQTRLVNMVPNIRSGETNQDAEPTITVDPNNHARMAGSAFTWDNLTMGPNVTASAPIYVSTDGGNTWSLAFIVPSKVGAGFPTGDITLNFSSTLSGALAHQTSWLYGGILSSTSSPRPMVVLRAQDPYAATLMATLDTRTGNVDQPHTTAETSGAQDKVYVGFNNGWGCVVPSGRTSTADVAQDGAAAVPTLTLDVIEARNSACQDGFAQVVAAHTNGTVYAAFIHDWSGTPRLVVVRDDNWAIGLNPFTALQDPSDAAAGRFVTTGLTLASGFMGQNRLGASNVSIAVDPNNSDRVYVAWGDWNGPSSETIHVRRSINRGVDWSGDLLTLTSAMNPQVAINHVGVVGVLYQSVTGGRWETRLARSNNPDATTFDTPGTLLASQSSTTPAAIYWPYIGDYASLVATQRGFVGMFSASNYPDKANFLTGVTYQRQVDWATHKLYADAAHTLEVAPSIDPFFFSFEPSAPPAFHNAFSLHAGVALPLGTLNTAYDPGPTGNVDVIFALTHRLALDFRGGLARFSASAGGTLKVWDISTNLKYMTVVATPWVFVNGGVGAYRVGSDWWAGANLGIGLGWHLLPPTLDAEATINYHRAFTPGDDVPYMKLQLGLIKTF